VEDIGDGRKQFLVGPWQVDDTCCTDSVREVLSAALSCLCIWILFPLRLRLAFTWRGGGGVGIHLLRPKDSPAKGCINGIIN